MAELRVSEWTKASDGDLKCPDCHAMNRPGVVYIEIGQDGRCYCTVCSAVFLPNP